MSIDDELRLTPGENIASVGIIFQSVTKTAGLNKPGATLPVPNKQPWLVTRQDHKDLLDEIDDKYGLIETTTTYVYVNKPVLDDLHNQGELSDTQYNALKQQLGAFNLNYDTIPDVFEGYRLGKTDPPLGKWAFPAPN